MPERKGIFKGKKMKITKSVCSNSHLNHLTDYDIIRASVIMQLLMPFLHHSTLAFIVSLESTNNHLISLTMNSHAKEINRENKGKLTRKIHYRPG
jgi:hypothetical protein